MSILMSIYNGYNIQNYKAVRKVPLCTATSCTTAPPPQNVILILTLAPQKCIYLEERYA